MERSNARASRVRSNLSDDREASFHTRKSKQLVKSLREFIDGYVAKFGRAIQTTATFVNCRIRLGGEAEQPGDEQSLANRIFFPQPSHSSLPNHVHGFDSL